MLGWWTLDNLSKTADMAAKLAAIVAVISALDLFASSPKLIVLRSLCAPALDRQAMAQMYGNEAVSRQGRFYRLTTALSPNRPLHVLLGQSPSFIKRLERRRRTSGTCQPHWTSRAGRKFLNDDSTPSPLEATVLVAEIAVMNVGSASATNVTVEAQPSIQGPTSPIRLRPNERAIIHYQSTQPGETFAYSYDPTFKLYWDSERQVNEHLLWRLILGAFIFLLFAVALDIYRSSRPAPRVRG